MGDGLPSLSERKRRAQTLSFYTISSGPRAEGGLGCVWGCMSLRRARIAEGLERDK